MEISCRRRFSLTRLLNLPLWSHARPLPSRSRLRPQPLARTPSAGRRRLQAGSPLFRGRWQKRGGTWLVSVASRNASNQECVVASSGISRRLVLGNLVCRLHDTWLYEVLATLNERSTKPADLLAELKRPLAPPRRFEPRVWERE